jgi:hypothetical protein
MRRSVILVLLILVPSAPLSADDLDNAALEGFVFDPTEAVIPDATITVVEKRTNKKRTATTDAQGWYRVATLPAGTYTVRAESPGFAAGEYNNLTLKAGQTVRQDVHLKVGSFAESVEVTEAAESRIDTTRTVIGLTIDGLEIDRVPLNGRNPLDLIFLFANVQAEPFELRDLGDPASRDFIPDTPQEAGTFSLSGGRAYSNNITIDGFDNNDDRLARERTIPSLESVAEVQIITNQFSAEYGRASGGRINFVTRRGNNEFHGAGFGDFQDESLNANSFFRNARGEKRQSFQRREYGGRLSGPVLPNRLFFFGAYERRDEPDTDSIAALLPVDSKANPLYPLRETPRGSPFTRDGVRVALFEDEISTPGSRTIFTGKLDHTLTQNHNLTFRFDATLTSRLRGRDQGATLVEGILNRRRNSTAYAFQDNLVIGQKLVNQFRFQYSALTPRNTQADPRPGVIVGSSRGQSLAFATGFIAGASGFPETRGERRFQFADALSWQQGRHSVKLGADAMHLRSSTTQLNLFFGFYNFPSFGDFVAGQPSRFRQRIGEPEQSLVNNIFGGFVQDEWRVRPNLTLSAGLRYDLETLLDHDRNNFGPRVAFAWDPFRTSKTVVRGGLGVFYNRVLLRTFEDFAVQSQLFEIDLGSEPGATGKIEGLSRIGGFPKVFPNDPTNSVVKDLIRPISNARSINPDLRIPYSLQSSLGVEREISRGFNLEVSYVLNRTLRLWRDSNVNAPIPPRGGLMQFLLNPPDGFPGVVKLPDGKTAFDNSARQISDASAGFVQFDLGAARFRDVGSGANRVRVYGLNGQGGGATTTDPVLAALNAVRFLRPNPLLGEVEQLQSDGQATYHGLNLIVSKRFKRGHFVRASYTLSKLIDFVDLNTSSPQDEFNLSLERGLGRTDGRHRFVVSGSLTLPRFLAALELSPLFTLSSGRPFSVTTNDQDRNLSDNSTDRPDFLGRGPIDYIKPGDTTRSTALVGRFTFSTIGTNGTLGRNVGRGPGITRVDVRFSRRFRLSEKTTLRPWVNVYNLTNTPNFVMAGFIGPLDERSGDSVFLQPRAARRPRTIELGLRVEF